MDKTMSLQTQPYELSDSWGTCKPHKPKVNMLIKSMTIVFNTCHLKNKISIDIRADIMLCLVSSREDNFGQDEQQSTYHQSWMNKNTIIRKQNDCLS
jgi:hypothetical protein